MKRLIGKKINNRFVLESIIGRGGMGCVFKALDLRKQEANNNNPYIAIKILNQELAAHQSAIELLEQECTNTQALKHPNIVTVNDFDRDGDITYITMEFLDGQTLRELLNSQFEEGIPYTRALEIISVLVDTLAFAHNAGVTHRDFKPENVFITNDNKIRIIDFGISKNAQNKSRSNDLEGISPGYSSFEMYYDFPAEPIDDVYSLACVSYEIFTGKHPFNSTKAPEAKRLSLVPEPVSVLQDYQYQAILHALQWERVNRTNTVTQFYKELTHKQSLSAKIKGFKSIVLVFAFLLILSLIYVFINYGESPDKQLDNESSNLSDKKVLIIKKNKIKDDSPEKVIVKEKQADKLIQNNNTNLSENVGKILLKNNNDSDTLKKSLITEDIDAKKEVTDDVIKSSNNQLIKPEELKKKSDAIIFYSGSTEKEIDEALIQCQKYSDACDRSWYETEYYEKNKLLPFKLDKYEISARLYSKFIEQTGYKTDAEKRGFSFLWNGERLEKAYGYTWAAPQGQDSSYRTNPDFPVVNISWQDANAYCRSQGGRLPSLEEWEYIARGTQRRLYPWGNNWLPENLNYNNTSLKDVNSFPEGTTPEGVHHMSGNVWEWTRTKVGHEYYLKGGSFVEKNPANLRAAMSRTDNASSSAPDDGFRCSYRVKYWPESQ